MHARHWQQHDYRFPLTMRAQVVVRHAGRSTEALLQLPAIPVRSSEGPAGLWLTVGLLAADGIALQLKLKKAEQVCESACLRHV